MEHYEVALRVNTAEVAASAEEVAQIAGWSSGQIDATTPETSLLLRDASTSVERALESLTERQRRVLKARFGFDAPEPMTYEEIATNEGVTKERIRQIEAKGIRLLKGDYNVDKATPIGGMFPPCAPGGCCVSPPGIHCHASCDDLHALPAGVVKPYGVQRVPKYGTPHRRATYEMTEASALSASFKFFGVTAPLEGAML